MATDATGGGRSGDAPRRTRLGTALRSARGTESLREVQRRTGISDSALSAYERDDRIPPRQFLELLDVAYEQGGGLLAHARFDGWQPEGEPGTVHRWIIPARWVGPVWCSLRTPDGRHTAVLFRWGPWARRVPVEDQDPAPGEQAFTMVVNRDGGADDRVLTCEAADPCWAFWGTGLPVAELSATDISEGWYPHEDGALLRLAGQLLSDALAHCGRSTAELAEFLGVEVAVVDALFAGVPLSEGT